MTTEGTRVETFDPMAFDTMPVQVWYDGWRSNDRVFRYVGDCVACNRPTWLADDGENDPRGVMGDNTCDPLVAVDHGMIGDDIPLCAIDANEYGPYKAALADAQCQWSDPEAE